MTKDYAKKRRPNYALKSKTRFQNERHTKKAFWPWVGTFCGLLFGAILALFVYWYGIPNSLKLHPPHLAKNNSKKEQPIKERRFDFYTVLPNTNFDEPSVETVAQASIANPTNVQPQAVNKPAVPSDSFIIQIGSFKSLHQAEELKALLALSGSEARIQTFRMGGKDTWHRVYIGPFVTKQQAELKLKQLNPAQVRNSLVIKNSV
jgi:cell division protein FtsN